MRALQFDISVPRYLLGRSLGKLTDWAIFGGPSGLSLSDLPDPGLPGPEWVGLDVISCGICGSDLGTLTFKSSPALEPFTSFPAVLGHEILARVASVGSAVTRVRVGDRVAVEPTVSCRVRGRATADLCPSCARSHPDGHAGPERPRGAAGHGRSGVPADHRARGVRWRWVLDRLRLRRQPRASTRRFGTSRRGAGLSCSAALRSSTHWI